MCTSVVQISGRLTGLWMLTLHGGWLITKSEYHLTSRKQICRVLTLFVPCTSQELITATSAALMTELRLKQSKTESLKAPNFCLFVG